MVLIAYRHAVLLLTLASIAVAIPSEDIASKVFYQTTLRQFGFKTNQEGPFGKNTPLGAHAEGLSNLINGLSFFDKGEDGKLKFKSRPKPKPKPSSTPTPTPTPTRTPTPLPSPRPRPKKDTKKEISDASISDSELKRLKEEAIRREYKRHKEELERIEKREREKREREKKEREERLRKQKDQAKKEAKKNPSKSKTKKKQKPKPKKKSNKPKSGGRNFKCTPGKKQCADGFWCVGKKGDTVCRRPKEPSQSCRGVKERCQVGSVCKKGICVVKYKKAAKKSRQNYLKPKEAKAFKKKTATDILGH